jgi:hypothetical protein
MGWIFSKTLGRKLVDKVSDGFSIKGVVQMGDGSTPGIVIDHSSTLVLDELGCEVVRITWYSSRGRRKCGSGE